MIHIDFWSDINCPYCFVAKRHLEKALEDLLIRNQVEIQYRSFELDPDGKMASEYDQNLVEMARQAGLDFHLEKEVPANSFNAHRLIQLGRSKSLLLQDRLQERLFDAKFTLGLDIDDFETLKEIAGEAGLDREEVDKVLRSDRFTQEVRMDELMGAKLGINAVPFIIINNDYAMAGAHPVDTMKEVLEKVWKSGGDTHVNP